MDKGDELEKAVGKLIVGSVQGLTLDHETKVAIETGIMGGVTLFKDNADSLPQLIQLIQQIHKLSPSLPLVSVDQEGGAVQRFDHILTPMPSAMSMAASKEQSWIPYLLSHAAGELKALGINVLLAPVLDICDNSLNPIVCTRSFGSDPKQVGELGLKVVETLKESSLLAVGKHFPGHGNTLEDSHLHLAVSFDTSEALWQKELVPFRHCINQIPAVMTGHIWFQEIDEAPLPASLSYRITTKILREYLNFDGLVITDDLSMKAVSDRWGLDEASVMAILAGADQVMFRGTVDEIRQVHKALLKAIDSGRIPEARFSSALKHINKAISLLPPFTQAVSAKDLQNLHATIQASVEKGKTLTKEFAVKSICLIKGKVPLASNGQWLIVAPKHQRYPLDLLSHLNRKALEQPAKKRSEFSEIRYVMSPQADVCQTISNLAKGKNVIFLTFRTRLNTGQMQLGSALAKSATKLLHVACDTPFDIQSLPDMQNSLATLDPSDLAMSALAEIIFGEWSPSGKCPVELGLAAKVK